jgi:hypothetical protein
MRGLAVALTLILWSIPQLAKAQEVTGGIEGWVVGEAGGPAAGTQIRVSGSSLQGSRSGLSDAHGYFRFLDLPVGSYTVSIRRLGYRPVTYEQITVRLGATTNLGAIRLGVEAVELPEIVVTPSAAPIDPTSAADRTNLQSQTLAELPLDRNFRSIISLAPQANLSYYGDEVNIAGATGLENTYYVDGINVTDPSNGATSTDLPYNFVQEIDIRTAGYEAEYGSALGGVINVVTPSGGNDFHGQVYSFFTSDALRTRPHIGLADFDPRSFSSYDVGASLGGPIARDRLWFYAAYNPTFGHQEIAVPGLSPRSASGIQHLAAGKLTWRVGPKTGIVLTAIGDPAKRDRVGPFVAIFGVPASVTNPEVVEGRLTQGGISLSLQAHHQLSPWLLVRASASRFSRRDDNEPRTAAALSEPLYRDLASGVWSGGYGGANQIRSTRSTVQASVTLSLPAHMVKLGALYEDNLTRMTFRHGAGGGGGGVISRSVNTTTGSATYSWFEFYSDGTLYNRIPTLYAQDSWHVSQRLRLNAGLRWSIERLWSPGYGVVTQIRDGPQPRIGFVYNIGQQKVYGSFGRFSEQLPLWLAINFGPGRNRNRRFSQDPRVDTTGAVVLWDLDNSAVAGEFTSARDLIGQANDEFTLGYECQLLRTLRLGVQGIYRNLRWALEDALSPVDSQFHFGNPGRGALSFLPRFKRQYAAFELTLGSFRRTAFPFLLSYILSRNYGNYTGLFATDALVAAPNVGPQGDNIQELWNGTGLLPNDRTHVLKGIGVHRFAFGLEAGVSLLWASGTPRSEYGGNPAGLPYWSFVVPRGSSGRTPALWDLNFRLGYDLPAFRGSGHPRVLLDIFHVGSPRRAATFDEVHYTEVDSTGTQTGVNATYGQVTHYQPPMSARLGLTLDF